MIKSPTFRTINHDTDLEYQLKSLVDRINADPAIQLTGIPQTVTGSRASGAALADLLTKLAAIGIIINSTSA